MGHLSLCGGSGGQQSIHLLHDIRGSGGGGKRSRAEKEGEPPEADMVCLTSRIITPRWPFWQLSRPKNVISDRSAGEASGGGATEKGRGWRKGGRDSKTVSIQVLRP